MQCGVTATCVTSFSISPSEIQGDGLHIATATASAVLAPGDSELLLEFIRPDSILWWICLPPATYAEGDGTGAGYEGGCHAHASSASVMFYAANGTTNSISIPITAKEGYTQDAGVTQTLTVDPIPTYTPEPPYQNPDTRCPSCDAQAGAPINLANGNTWITQQD